MNVSWTQKITNDEVLRLVGQKRKLLQIIKQRNAAVHGLNMQQVRDMTDTSFCNKNGGKVAAKRKPLAVSVSLQVCSCASSCMSQSCTNLRNIIIFPLITIISNGCIQVLLMI